MFLNAIRGGVMGGDEYRVLNKPRARAYLGITGSVANATASAITFDTKDYDTDSIWTVGGSVFTANTPGLYDVEAHVVWAAAAGGTLRWAYLVKNGVTGIHYADDAPGPNGANIVWSNCKYKMVLNKGETVQLYVYQDSGGALAFSLAFGVASADMSICLLSTLG